MKASILVLTILGLSFSTQAKQIFAESYTVAIEIQTVTLQLEAKCQAPRNEDDAFKPI